MDSAAILGGLAITLVIVIVAFFIFRGLLLWYWKIDKIEEHLTKTEDHLSAIRILLEQQQRKNNTIGTNSPDTKDVYIPTGIKKMVNPKSAMKNLEPLKDEE